MSGDPEAQEKAELLTVANYRPTKYADTGWPIVGEFRNNNEFEPMEFRTVSNEDFSLDPMFDDFGGSIGGSEVRRHGVSDTASYSPTKRVNSEEIEAEVTRRLQARQAQLTEQVATARAQGFEEGKQSALADTQAMLQESEQRYQAILQDLGVQLNESIGAVEQHAVKLALQISEKLVGSTVDINPEYIVPIVKEALKLAGTATIRSVKVSPQDFEFLSMIEQRGDIKGSEDAWRFEADQSIRAGCVVQMVGGEVDYRLDQAWERIREQIMRNR